MKAMLMCLLLLPGCYEEDPTVEVVIVIDHADAAPCAFKACSDGAPRPDTAPSCGLEGQACCPWEQCSYPFNCNAGVCCEGEAQCRVKE